MEEIKNMTDKQKLDYIVGLLSKDIYMFTDYSDTQWVDFTDEYLELEKDIEEFLDAIKNKCFT